jgi:long-chain fatty acid transport protein
VRFISILSFSVIGGARLALLVVAADVYAAGFYVPPQGAVGVGLAQAGKAARANDGSTVYSNPAGMTQLDGALVQGGIDFIVPDINIKNAGSTSATPGTGGAALLYSGVKGEAGEVTPIPSLYLAYPMRNKNLWLGLAITSPFGLALDYGNDWFGRYDSIKSKLLTIDFAPSLAYKINDA